MNLSEDETMQGQMRIETDNTDDEMKFDQTTGSELNQLIKLVQPDVDWCILDIIRTTGHTVLASIPSIQQVETTLLNLQFTQHDLSGQQGRVVAISGEQLPFPDTLFDLVLCRNASSHFSDVFRFMQSCERILKPGGRLLVQEVLMPNNERAAAYVNALLELQNPAHVIAYPEYAWQGLFLDAGLHILKTMTMAQHVEVASWAKTQKMTPDTVLRLQIMLAQAPHAAAEWLRPQYSGTSAARFLQHSIIMVGEKEK